MHKHELLTPSEVADYLGVKPQTVTKWLRQGRLKGIKLGRLWRISERALWEFQEEVPDTWILELHISPKANGLWLVPSLVPTVDPDLTLEMPDEWWESLVDTLPDGDGWEDVKEHIKIALRNHRWERADLAEESKEGIYGDNGD